MMQFSGTTKAIHDIEEAIRHKQSPDEILSLLSRLLEVTESSSDLKRISVGRMNQLAAYLAEIGYLLERFGSEPNPQGISRMAREMAARYRDLEGKVKEIRNDCTTSRAVNG